MRWFAAKTVIATVANEFNMLERASVGEHPSDSMCPGGPIAVDTDCSIATGVLPTLPLTAALIRGWPDPIPEPLLDWHGPTGFPDLVARTIAELPFRRWIRVKR